MMSLNLVSVFRVKQAMCCQKCQLHKFANLNLNNTLTFTLNHKTVTRNERLWGSQTNPEKVFKPGKCKAHTVDAHQCKTTHYIFQQFLQTMRPHIPSKAQLDWGNFGTFPKSIIRKLIYRVRVRIGLCIYWESAETLRESTMTPRIYPLQFNIHVGKSNILFDFLIFNWYLILKTPYQLTVVTNLLPQLS
jgi:hypothetical protein